MPSICRRKSAERRGWGHSTYEEVVALAQEAEVHNLLLTHHDPCRSDGGGGKDRGPVPGNGDRPQNSLHYIDAAREGACYRLP